MSFRIRPQPADRCLAVLDLRRENRLVAEAMADAGHSVSFTEERKGLAGIGPAATKPGAAVDPHDHWDRGIGLCREVEIELLLLMPPFDVLYGAEDFRAFRQF